MFSYPSVLSYVLGAQKNRLIETVLLSTHNIWFGWELRKLFFFGTHSYLKSWNDNYNDGDNIGLEKQKFWA